LHEKLSIKYIKIFVIDKDSLLREVFQYSKFKINFYHKNYLLQEASNHVWK
jgi:hypothetical protein